MTASRPARSGQQETGQAGPQETGQQETGQAGPQEDEAAGQPPTGKEYEYAPPGGSSAPGRVGPAGSMLSGQHGWLVLLGAAAAFLVVGLILLVWPHATLTIAAILIGIALIVTGLVRLFDGFTDSDESGGRRVVNVLIGALAVIVGLYCLKHHGLSIAIVAFVVGVFWLLHGIADIGVAATAHGMPGRGLLAISGLFSVIAGLLVLFWPAITVVLLVVILGIWLIIYAAVLAVLAFQLRPRRGSAAQHATA